WNDSTEQSQLAALQKEMAETKSLVLSSLENTTSASTRLNGINVAYEKGSVDKEVIRVLVKTMNEDENVNVRLAAVRALAKFSNEPGVTQALVNALENQKEALVQIALINLMVELQQKGVLDKLQQIIEDENALDAVKDEAHMAVFKLS
ncbi:MAG: HEAT repeat domain-containing protein, partial [Bacteroidota bacterium]